MFLFNPAMRMAAHAVRTCMGKEDNGVSREEASNGETLIPNTSPRVRIMDLATLNRNDAANCI